MYDERQNQRACPCLKQIHRFGLPKRGDRNEQTIDWKEWR